MFTKEQLDAIRQKPEAERTPEEKEALVAAERNPDKGDFPATWEEVFNHPRFKQLVKRASDAEAEAERVRGEQETAKAEALKEQGKWKELYEQEKEKNAQLKSKADRVEAYETTLSETLDAQLKELPEASRKLVPDELTTQQKLNWISKNRPMLMKPAAPGDLGAGKRGNGPTKEDVELSAPEKELARRFGMTDKEYAKYRDSEELGGGTEESEEA